MSKNFSASLSLNLIKIEAQNYEVNRVSNINIFKVTKKLTLFLRNNV